MPNFLENPGLRLLFFGGKGGVGKTTCAAATALHYANRFAQRSVLLVSTDPAHSLADSIGAFHLPENVKVLEFNAQESLQAFKASHRGQLAEIAARGTFLDQEDIHHILDLSLPGLDELMAMLAIGEWVEAGTYDLIVVDTAPTGHTLRLLTTPDLMRTWLKALDALLAKHRFMEQRFRGSHQPDELDQFLMELAASIKRAESMLRNPRICRFVPVMLAENLVISETLNLLDELRRLQIPVREVVVNRLYPENSCPLCSEGRRRQQHLMSQLLSSHDLGAYAWWGVLLAPKEMRGPALTTFWDGVSSFDAAMPTFIQPSLEIPPHVEAAAPCPPAETRFLIFAGKGGVGKTTLACATALRLAHEFRKKQIFLFSTDPANSLAACLETPVGPHPVGIAPGLTAMEIDAPAEFAALKNHYRQELGRFLHAALENFDVPFDRQVMEQILDLSPPGLDEIMALVRAMEFMEQGRYDIFILDSAPTGHLLRLLELPELIDQWLKTFFRLLLKYNLALRFPDISHQLVRISRNLKFLRSLWRDPDRTALYAVTILTEMSFQETSDLLAVCGRLGVPTPVLLLNLATPASDCPLCTALNRREKLVKDKFRQTFPGLKQTIIYRQSEPRGLKRLSALGQVLYRSGIMEKRHGVVTDMPALSV